jgi:hypothetical protein
VEQGQQEQVVAQVELELWMLLLEPLGTLAQLEVDLVLQCAWQ